MSSKAAWMIASLLVALPAGCGGGGDAVSRSPPPIDPAGGEPPPPPPPDASVGGLWIGTFTWSGFELGETVAVRGLIAETGEFRLALQGTDEQVFGTLQTDGTDVVEKNDLTWAITWDPVDPFWLTGSFDGSVEERAKLFGRINGYYGHWGTFRSGTLDVAFDPLYEQDSSLPLLSGAYSTATESLAIDQAGALFYQSSDTGCVGNGRARVIDPDFNLYRIRIDLEGCTGEAEARNGLSFTGLAFLSDSDEGRTSDVVELVLSAEGKPFGYVTWNLLARR